MAIPYKTLEPSAFGETVTIDSNFVGLGGSLVLVIVTTGVLLAIFFRFVPAIYGFMSGDNESKRTEAKKNFWAGLLGVGFILLLIPFATSINKTIGQFSLSANSSATTPSTNTGGTTGTTPSNPGTVPTTYTNGGPAFQQSLADDKRVRDILKAGNVSVNNLACTAPMASNCTSLGGLSQETIDMLLLLKQSCPSCTVQVSGGTETWLHGNRKEAEAGNTTAHRPGGRAVDLSMPKSDSTGDLAGTDSVLTRFIKTNGTRMSGISGKFYSRWAWGGFIFGDEIPSGSNTGRHWHVQ